MSRYRLLLNGQNFLLNLQGTPKKFGFYTTRDVEAESFEDAELKAIEIIREDESLGNNVFNGKNDSPMIYVEEARVLESNEEALKIQGFTFYVEENRNSS